MNLEQYFEPFRKGIIGHLHPFNTPFGEKQIHYFDWVASGRLYAPLEEKMRSDFGPFVANTHTESNWTGQFMTRSYKHAHHIIKKHVNANEQDVIITQGTGMTGVINKLQRLLCLKYPEHFDKKELALEDKPVVFITHMEHHSNHTSWIETIGDVVVIPPNEEGLIDLQAFDQLLQRYKARKRKIGAFSACSNVSGIQTPYHTLARMMHIHNGIAIIDFAASAPYVSINMHPDDPLEKLDAIVFSPHKFLGGPGTSGVLIFDSNLYQNQIPDQPGGGTVTWTNPWGGRGYIRNIEEREDGGTPGFLQTIRTALCIELKEAMGVEQMERREEELLDLLFTRLSQIDKVKIMADQHTKRLPIVSFFVEGIHFNLIVRLLNDLYGIQVRGGCSCAGTYGHYLLNIDEETSHSISSQIDLGGLVAKPGWIRVSLHPTMQDKDVLYFISSLREIIENIEELSVQYEHVPQLNDYHHIDQKNLDLSPYFSFSQEKGK
ncbi:aminotransferase class V-fold PLP-dependent enzyme [Bacillus sp. 2205SS5-2]|uniref:aminotransferase class V-fold PLP-dependent enzyme n=1 Tax=Bacillus sp. 2205SS5-2 TaxID=3109031 RepID=UPI0030058690